MKNKSSFLGYMKRFMKQLFVLLVVFLYCSSGFGQRIKESETKYNYHLPDGKTALYQAKKYTVFNNDSTPSILLFVEEDNTTLSKIKLIKRKLMRKYGDFRLSMLAWEPYMILENGLNQVPELFVKIIAPGDSFDIIFILTDNSCNPCFDILPKHLLICKEEDLCDKKVGLNNFVSAVNEYNFGFPFSFVVIDSESFSRFVLP